MKKQETKLHKISAEFESDLLKLQEEQPDIFWAFITGDPRNKKVNISIMGDADDVIPGIATMVVRIARASNDNPVKESKRLFRRMERVVAAAFKDKKKAAKRAGEDGSN